MVTVDMHSELDWLRNELNKVSGVEGWWLGYASNESNRQLTKGSDVVNLILNSSSADDRNEQCVYFFKNTTNVVADCSRKMGYICKRKPSLPVKCELDHDWFYIQGTCFRYYTDTLSWNEANFACKDEARGSLATIQTIEQLWFIWYHAKMSASVSWNGFSFNNKENQFQWIDGSPLLQWWNDDKSNVSTNKSDTCGVIDGTKNITSAWTTGNCNDERTVVCMRPPDTCPDGWNTIDDTCFKLFVEPILNWVQARDYCNQMGAQLLKITSQNIQNEVLLTAKPLMGSLRFFWIGISDETGNFTWSDGTEVSFTFWDDNPHQHLKGNRRGIILMGYKNGRWRTDLSNRKRSFGCSMYRNRTNTYVKSHSIFNCETDWNRSGQSCVSRKQSKKSWPDAYSTCDKLHSKLLNIESDTHLGIFSDDMYWVSKESADKIDLPYFNITWSKKDKVNCPLLHYITIKEIEIQASNCSSTYEFYCEKPAVNLADYYLTTVYDADCGLMWEKRPGTDLCYQFRQAKMTWPHALQQCTDQNSSLASITTSEEQKYIEGKLHYLHFLQFWIGASDRRELFNIQWEDGNPFLYSNWEQGKPEFKNVPNCIGINADSKKWNDYSCYLSIGFICKKKAISSQVTTTSPTSTPRVLPSNFYNGCPPGWYKYGGYCYQINTQDANFDGAMVNCQNQNSTLASIHSMGENGFLWSLLLPDKRYWIGGISINDKSDLVWSDSTIFNYSKYESSSQFTGSDLFNFLQFNQKTGTWYRLENTNIADGYICKKPTVIVSSPPIQPYSTGCMEVIFLEGYAYAEYCYTMYDNLTSWDEAQKFCQARNSNLAVVSDRVINDFLSSVFGHGNGSNFWIGLSLVKGKRNWVRQILPGEEFWDRQFTGNDDGCATMNSTLQHWQLKNCSSIFHFVCETVRQGFTTQTVPTTTTLITPILEDCPSNWTYYVGLCYKVFGQAKPWYRARSECESLGWNLASIHDESTNTFITDLMKNAKVGNYVWIGLHNNNDGRAAEWTDGSHLDFLRWSHSPPNSMCNVECCAEMTVNGNWNGRACFVDWPFVCSLNPAPLTAPISTIPAPRCLGSDWIYHNGFCYFSNDDLKTWQDAETDCISRGGHLASVLSEEENNFLTNQNSNMDQMWIGYNRIKNDSFLWSDGKPNGFEIFFRSQGVYAASNCVSVDTEDGGWYTNPCDLELKYICKKINDSIVSTVPTTTQRIEKICPAGFVGSDKIDKCYTVGGLQEVEWDQARSACGSMSSKLASINSAQEQDVVNTLASKLNVGLWIGLKDEDGFATSFTWQDGSNLAYTYWANNYPQREIDHYTSFHQWDIHFFFPFIIHHIPIYMSTCVIHKGRWINTDCSLRYAYICQKPAIFRAVSVTETVSSPLSTTTEGIVTVQTSTERVSIPPSMTTKEIVTVQTSTERVSIPPSRTIKDLNNTTSSVRVSSQLSTLLSKDSGPTVLDFTVSDPEAQSSSTTSKSVDVSTKPPNIDFLTDRFNDHPSTTTVNISSSTSKDIVHFTSYTDSVTEQLSNATSGSVNITSLRSENKISDPSISTTDTALIVLGLLALVGCISFVVTKIVRLKWRRAHLPIQSVSKDAGFYNVLYSSLHEPDN